MTRNKSEQDMLSMIRTKSSIRKDEWKIELKIQSKIHDKNLIVVNLYWSTRLRSTLHHANKMRIIDISMKPPNTEASKLYRQISQEQRNELNIWRKKLNNYGARFELLLLRKLLPTFLKTCKPFVRLVHNFSRQRFPVLRVSPPVYEQTVKRENVKF